MSLEEKNITIASLFAGIGGICLGFKNAGAEVIWANDNDKHAFKTYTENFPNTVFDKRSIVDIPTNEIPDHDILTGGFPCQAFSIAGYQNGFNDDRGNLFFQIERILIEKDEKTKVIFLENVKNLETHDNKRTFKIINSKLLNAGYYIKSKVLNTADYGNLPQNRERIYIVGFRDRTLCENFNFPKKIKLTKTIHDIVNISERKPVYYYYNEKSQYYEMLKSEVTKFETVYQLRRVYVRENKSNICPTLTANMGTGGHNVPIIRDNYGIRKLTPRETFMLQGFPENFKFPKGMARSHLYKQIGNSVSVTVIQRIAENIIKVLIDK